MSEARFRRPRFRKRPTDHEPLRGRSPASLRRVLLFATWLAGTLLATAVVYEAVHMVAGQVTELQADGVSQGGVEHGIAQTGAPPSTPPQAAPGAPPNSPGSVSGPSPPGQATPAVTEPPSTPTKPSQQAPANDTRTFSLVGGTANVTCSGSQITLNWATPNGGYEVVIGSSSGGGLVEVRFRSDTHESRLEAWCAGGQVQSSIREESS